MRTVTVLTVLALAFPAIVPAQSAADFIAPAATARSGWAYFDGPLWDLADEGLPFRLTVALPSRRDVITRSLFANEARWTFSTGYARVYNSYDAATGVFQNHGGDALLLSAGRQMFWALPAFAGRYTPRIALEYGINFASTPFPADGTRFNFKLITGLEWVMWRKEGEPTSWSAGIYWPHFSNANLLSGNAGYDGLAFRIGRKFEF